MLLFNVFINPGYFSQGTNFQIIISQTNARDKLWPACVQRNTWDEHKYFYVYLIYNFVMFLVLIPNSVYDKTDFPCV